MATSRSSPPRVYLAGPDVFFPQALNLGRNRKAVLAGLGMEGVFPLDEQPAGEALLRNAHSIFEANRQLIDSCQAVLANVTPFRGPSADIGTVWEIGYACGQRKPVVAYSHDLSIYREKVFRHGWSLNLNEPRDSEGNEIENFEGIDNLMLTQSVVAICARFEDAAIALKRVFARVSESKH